MFKEKLENLIFKAIFLLFLRKMGKTKKSQKLTRIASRTMVGRNKKGELKEIVPETPKEGGILTHFPNLPFPFPGFPDNRIVVKVALAKRLIPFGIDWIHKQIKPFVPKNPNLYCRAVREIYRVFNIMIERDTRMDMKEKFAKMRDIVCIFAEYDDAYRFIGQDVAPEMRLEEFKLSDGDKWWFLKKPYNFKGKEEFKKKYGKVKLEDN